MRKCRVQQIKLTDANEAFLAFCEAYGPDEQEKLRTRYERFEQGEETNKQHSGSKPIKEKQENVK